MTSYPSSRPSLRPLLSFGALALVVALVSASCAKDAGRTEASPPASSANAATAKTERPAGQPPQTGGQLSIGLASETDGFNPYSGTWSISSYAVANAILEPLAAIDDQGIAHAYLAEAIDTTPDFREWTIKLRSGVTFHNGEPLDANAVKRNLDTGRRSGLTAQAFTAVDAVDVVDSLTVRVRMNRPWATFPASLAVQAGYMAAPAMLDDPAGANAKPIGTGPFEFQDRQRDAFVKARKYEFYWQKDRAGRPLPYLDSVQFKVIADTTSRRSALNAGDIDAMVAVTPDALISSNEAAGRGELQVVSDANQETDETVLAMNTSREPFDDPLARQILAYGLDQQQLATSAYQGAFPGAWGMFEEGSPYYVSRKDAGYPDHDTAKARQLEQQYEQKHGKPLEFGLLVPPDPQYLSIAQTFQAQVGDLGVKVNIQAIEQTQLVNKVIVAGDYQGAGFVLWSSPTPDRAYIFLATKANPNGLSLNYSRFDDPEIVAAMDQFRASGDPQQRIELIKRVQKSLAKNLQTIFLVHNRSAFVYSNGTHGAQAITFAGTDRPAHAPYVTTPFLAAMWKGPTG